MRIWIVSLILFMSCRLGRPPQTAINRDLVIDAWAVQPGLEASIEREVLSSIASIGSIEASVMNIRLVTVQEQPQLLFPEQGTLWLLRIEIDVTGQNLTEPMRIVGQAHYTFEDTAQFSLSRQEAYAQAVSQISEQLSASLSYQKQTPSD